MKFLISVLWSSLGFITAHLFIKGMAWSVALIHPNFPKRSKRLIVGGAIIRWLLIFFLLLLVLSVSIEGMFIVFISFMIARIYMLSRQQNKTHLTGKFSID